MSITEQVNPLTVEIDRLPTLEALRLMNAEDQRVRKRSSRCYQR